MTAIPKSDAATHSVRDAWGRQVTMASHGLFEPAVNYYRKTMHYDWLEPIPGDGIKDRMADVYITLWDDFDRIPANKDLTQLISLKPVRLYGEENNINKPPYCPMNCKTTNSEFSK